MQGIGPERVGRFQNIPDVANEGSLTFLLTDASGRNVVHNELIARSVTLTYDANNNLVSTSSQILDRALDDGTKRIESTLDYDGSGNLTSITQSIVGI